MSPRMTRNITLGLVGSAALLTLFSCNSHRSRHVTTQQIDTENYAGGDIDGPTANSYSSANPIPGTVTNYSHRTTTRHYTSRPWLWGWGSSYSSHPSYTTHTTTSSHPSGSSSSSHSTTHSATSRGGFGSTGHAHASGGS